MVYYQLYLNLFIKIVFHSNTKTNTSDVSLNLKLNTSKGYENINL